MKPRLFLLFFVFVFTSCHPNMIKMVDGYYTNGNPKRINYYISIDRSELLKKELYYENGQIKLSGNYKENLKHGQWRYYFENGIISDETWFIEGLLEGRSSSFYKNGVLRSSGYYQKGRRVRMWTYFDENGQLVKKINFSRE